MYKTTVAVLEVQDKNCIMEVMEKQSIEKATYFSLFKLLHQ